MRSVQIFAVMTLTASAAEIPQGTHVLLRLENSVSTGTAKEGDFVYLRTAVPITARASDRLGLATVLLTGGKEVELRQGSTLDVVFDRPVSLE